MFKLKVKYYRLEKGLTQKTLSQLSGLNQSYISKLEKYDREESPTLHTLEQIAEVLGICPLQLLECHCKFCNGQISVEVFFMNIAIYSRKSKFVIESESVENQVQICKDFIEHNYKNVKNILVFEDEGFSGKNTDRPQFREMMKQIKSKKIDVILCYKLDRMNRNVRDFSDTLETLEKYNVNFVSVTERFDTSTPMGRAMIYIASVFAQLERETIAERVKDNMIELAKDGKYLGGRTALGYKKIGIGKNAKFEIDNSTLVKNIFNKYIEFSSLAAVHKWTIREGLKTQNDRYFTLDGIKRILNNSFYCVGDLTFYNYAKFNNMIICNSEDEFKSNSEYGIVCYNKQCATISTRYRNKKEWIVAIGTHKAIISSNIFVKVQNELEKNSVKAPRQGTSQDALLGGLIKCANCGSGFRITANYNRGERKQYYYKCRGKSESNTLLCNVKNINGLKADQMIIDYIKSIGKNEKALTNLFKEYCKDINTDEINIEIRNIAKKIEENNAKIEGLTNNLINLNQKSVITIVENKIAAIDNNNKELNKKLFTLESRKEELKNKKNGFLIFKDSIIYISQNIDKMDKEQKKRAIRELIKKITWDGENLKVELMI